jgi:hypothetical protein
MREPNQKLRFTTIELNLLKGLFADNEELLFLIRKVMLQFTLTQDEKDLLARTMNNTVWDLMRKVFSPELDPSAPILQLAHMAVGLDIKSLSPDGAWPFIKAKEIEMNYINQQLEVLRGGTDEPKIVLNDLVQMNYIKKDRELAYINLNAWNFLLAYIDSNINQMKVLAGLKSETVEETIKRLAMNSNK